MPRSYFTTTYYGRTKLFTERVASTVAVAKDIAQPASSFLTWEREYCRLNSLLCLLSQVGERGFEDTKTQAFKSVKCTEYN